MFIKNMYTHYTILCKPTVLNDNIKLKQTETTKLSHSINSKEKFDIIFIFISSQKRCDSKRKNRKQYHIVHAVHTRQNFARHAIKKFLTDR